MLSAAPPPAIRIVATGKAAAAPLQGRMLLFIARARGAHPPAKLEPGFVASGVSVEGFEVHQAPKTAVTVPADAFSFPAGVATLPAGRYDIQPLLDTGHTYSYYGVYDGDLAGPVQRVRLMRGGRVTLVLDRKIQQPAPRATSAVRLFSVKSALLSKFYGRPFRLRASVVLPVGYTPSRRYPVVYAQNGFGGDYTGGFELAGLRTMMHGDGLDALVVVTDSTTDTGIAQFADSANNGPWGRAFTTEFIPALERAFPVDARPQRRFLWGHSSGGWASLWLQIAYPALFGGTWSSSPDPVDFHDFTGPDLVSRPPDNAYFTPFGRPWQLVRDGTKDVMTLRDFVLFSDAEGFRESQFGSFDAVFSPRGADGNPLPLFDHRTGRVNPAVAAYWEANYDIAARIERAWPSLQSVVAHKVHIAVGTLDTFHLERGVLRLDARIRRLGVTPDITYFPGASHFSLFRPSTGFEGFHWAFRGMAKAAKESRK
ncbi:MAG TPA: alpha/beta hydrolase-fold protein [Candidatus Baltobacteraceae bacterium]|nr:alpha/beta hydrolase-fold protein [Candidatus Baltobacteraceae bacterium]